MKIIKLYQIELLTTIHRPTNNDDLANTKSLTGKGFLLASDLENTNKKIAHLDVQFELVKFEPKLK